MAKLKFKLEDVQEAMRDDVGFCVRCGEPHENIEPDIERARCGACGTFSVYGAEQLFVVGLVE